MLLFARRAQWHVRGHVDGGEAFAAQQHAGFRSPAQFRNVLGMSGERASRECDRFLVHRRRHHGFGLAAKTHLRRDPHVLDGGHATARIQPAEREFLDSFQRPRVAQLRPERDSRNPAGHFQHGGISHYDPARQRRELRIGHRLQHDLGSDPGRVAHGQRDDGQVLNCLFGHERNPLLESAYRDRRNRRTWSRPELRRTLRRGECRAEPQERFHHTARCAALRPPGIPAMPYLRPKAPGRPRAHADLFAHPLHRDQPARNAQDHVFAARQRVANRFPRRGLGMEQHGSPFGQQRRLLRERHTVIRSDAEQRGAASRGRRRWCALSADGPCQRRGQAPGPRPQNAPAHGQDGCRNAIQIEIAVRIHGHQARACRESRRDALRPNVRTRKPGLKLQAAGNIDGSKFRRVRHPQMSALHHAMHFGKRRAHHGRIAMERFQRGGDFHARVAAQGGIDLLEDARRAIRWKLRRCREQRAADLRPAADRGSPC